MSNLGFWDHAFLLVVFLIYPVYSKFTFNGVLEDIRKRGERGRIAAYREVILTWVIFALCVAGLWILLGREWADLGVRSAGVAPLAVGLAIAGAFIALVVYPLRKLSRSPEHFGELDAQLGDIGLFMPRSRSEDFWFKGVSINAGLFEELIFRGYLVWYLEHFFGPWWTASIAVLWFAFAHMYQGLKHLPGVLLMSVVTVGLFLHTRSLLVPVLFHIVLDVLQGHYIAKIRRLQANAA